MARYQGEIQWSMAIKTEDLTHPCHLADHQINLGALYNSSNFGFGWKNNQCTQFLQNICFGAVCLPSPVFEQCSKFRSLWPRENRESYREKQHKNY